MSSRRIAVLSISGLLLAGGAGAAIAASTKDDVKKDEQAVLDDAAKRLDVTPDRLRDALVAARAAQLDQAVKDGRLTQRQADAIKDAVQKSGRVLGGPHPGPRFHGGPRHLRGAFGPHALFADLAKALGITQDKLHERLRGGDTIAAIAKTEGKSLDDIRSAVKAAARTRLDKAVKDGDITRKLADAMVSRLDQKLEHLDKPRRLRPGRRGEDGPMRLHPGRMRPGSVSPGEVS